MWPDELYGLNNLRVWLKSRNLDKYYSSMIFIVSTNFYFILFFYVDTHQWKKLGAVHY